MMSETPLAVTAETIDDGGELTVTLPSGQEITVYVGTSLADGSALVQIDTAGTPGNVRIFVNDSDDPVLDEDPETGQYRDMSGEDADGS